MAEYKVVDAEQLDADLTEIADEVRVLTDTSNTMTIEQMIDNIAQANADIETQADLIAQIKTVLYGKTAGSGSEIIAEIVSLIDQSGVLESTDGTVTDKVGELIDKADFYNTFYKMSELWTNQFGNLFAGGTTFKTIPFLSFKKATLLRGMCNNSSIERIDYYIDSGACTNIRQAFMYCKKLNFLYGVDISNCLDCFQTFLGCEALETIQEPLNLTSATNVGDIFKYCTTLKNIRFVPETIKLSITIPSPVLSNESIKSILRGLAPVETMQTLKLHFELWNKLVNTEDEELYALYDEALVDKGWDIAY